MNFQPGEIVSDGYGACAILGNSHNYSGSGVFYVVQNWNQNKKELQGQPFERLLCGDYSVIGFLP